MREKMYAYGRTFAVALVANGDNGGEGGNAGSSSSPRQVDILQLAQATQEDGKVVLTLALAPVIFFPHVLS